MREMKTVRLGYRRQRYTLLHVEMPMGIVNIHVGLHDAKGRDVVAVGIIPDRYAGEQKVIVRGTPTVRLIRAKKARN